MAAPSPAANGPVSPRPSPPTAPSASSPSNNGSSISSPPVQPPSSLPPPAQHPSSSLPTSPPVVAPSPSSPNNTKTPPPANASPISPPPPPPTVSPSSPSARSPPPKSSPPPPPRASPASSPTVSPLTPNPVSPVANSPPPSPQTSNPSPSRPSTPATRPTTKSPPPPSTYASPPKRQLSPPSSSSPPADNKTTSATLSPASSGKGSSHTGTIVGITVAVGAVVLLSVCVFLWKVKNKKKKKKEHLHSGDIYGPPYPPRGNLSQSMKSDGAYSYTSAQFDQKLMKVTASPHLSDYASSGYIGGQNPLAPVGGHGFPNARSSFSYEELAVATNGFSPDNVLGEGGFGCVYKGVLSDNKVVAVKQLKIGSGQGEREFCAEVETISRIHHRHLVSLVGYCISGMQRLLVYDYVPNGTLEHHLHGKQTTLSWATRIKVAVGAARGLAYLHEDCHPRIIHRDIKSANILLDENFEAQVSDFGLAKMFVDANTHVSTRVVGTFGYLAPEYAASGKLTEKSDVYSFGVVLLELITGQKPIDSSHPFGEEGLVEWARPLLSHALEEGKIEDIVDPKLENNYDEAEMFRMVEAAAACVRHSSHHRPKMGQVLRALESTCSISDLNNGCKPGQSAMFNTAEMKRFRRMAFGCQEFSSDYTDTSSDFGTNQNSNEFLRSRELGTKHSREWGLQQMSSANGHETYSSSESETCPIYRSHYHHEDDDRNSDEVPIIMNKESLSAR
eukprot:TRINITY_DN1966_c0_g1_i1.p1 TRINITY_DN1966_c0_g1~~TRINITY_DN1966_c0_g1_i1.p1  ORF type:complete len:732 (+),score=169.71 TRINITY_DN1966_c0_g1_i1:493-2688(+)